MIGENAHGNEGDDGPEDADDLLASLRKKWKDGQQFSRDWREKAREDFDFVAGNQWSVEDAEKLADQDRPLISFNRIDPIIDMISGSEVQNREEVQYVPRTPGASGQNEVLTDGAKWLRDQCDAEDEESDAFRDMAICGMGWTETRIDYEQDADGQVIIERTDPISMYWDPAARKKNLADARWVAKLMFWPKEDVKATWPEKWDELSTDGGPWNGDGAVHTTEVSDPATAYDHTNITAETYGKKGLLTILHIQWFERGMMYRVINPATQQIEDLPAEKFEAIKAQIKAAGIRFVKVPTRIYKRAFICGDTMLEEGDVPGGEGFTFRCMTGKRDRNQGTYYGIVRAMKDPQRWANKFFSQILHILNTNAKGGVMAEVGAVANKRRFEEDWAKPDKVQWLNDGALGAGKIQEKPVTPYPSAIDGLMQFTTTATREVTGINMEMLGQADRDQAGVLEYQRRQTGLTVLTGFFDSLRRYRKEQGRILLGFIREYLSDGRLVRVVGPEGAQYVPLAMQPDTAKYDVIVDAAPSAPNQKEKTFQVLQAIAPMMAQAGATPPLEIFDYLPLPTAFAQKWKQQAADIQKAKASAPPPQDPEMVKAQGLLALEDKRHQDKMALAQAEIASDERMSRFKAELQAQVEQSKQAFQQEQNNAQARIQAELEAMRNQNAHNLAKFEAAIDVLKAIIAKGVIDPAVAQVADAQFIAGQQGPM